MSKLQLPFRNNYQITHLRTDHLIVKINFKIVAYIRHSHSHRHNQSKDKARTFRELINNRYYHYYKINT